MRVLLLAATLCVAGCQSTPPDEALVRDCAALVAAEPGRWPDAAEAVFAHGRAAAPTLAAALDGNRDGGGAQLAIAVLAELDPSVAAEPLRRWLAAEEPTLSAEAALALGRIGDRRSSEELRRRASDRGEPTLVRTACACALLDLDEIDHAVPFLYAVLVAGTPAGRGSSALHGLEDRQRWALERGLAIDAIRRHTGGDDFGLDADSPWPRLQAAAERFLRSVSGEAPPR